MYVMRTKAYSCFFDTVVCESFAVFGRSSLSQQPSPKRATISSKKKRPPEKGEPLRSGGYENTNDLFPLKKVPGCNRRQPTKMTRHCK